VTDLSASAELVPLDHRLFVFSTLRGDRSDVGARQSQSERRVRETASCRTSVCRCVGATARSAAHDPTHAEPGHAAAEPNSLGVPVDVHDCGDGSDNEPFAPDSAVVLTAHERERADDEGGGNTRQCAYGAVSVRCVFSDHVDVERHRYKDQARENRRAAPDHDEEVLPLIRSVYVERDCHRHVSESG
jgi:hypothetical protein